MAAPSIRLAAADDLPRLPDIELAAAALFPEGDLPALLRLVSTPEAALAAAQREGRLWVAERHGEQAGRGFNGVARKPIDGPAMLAEIARHTEVDLDAWTSGDASGQAAM